MDGYNVTNVKADSSERRVGEQLQTYLFMRPSLEDAVLPGDGACCLVLAL